jgi:aminoglycoside phosphotransferase (APT) family kinase protein
LLQGGRSNLTYVLTDGQRRWVLRRPPLGGLTPSAHDMSREYQVVAALRDSGVPVARAVVLVSKDVLGVPFSIVEYVDGRVIRTTGQLHELPAADITPCAFGLIDALHAKLAKTCPGESGASIVHGEYRIDNVILNHEDAGTVRVVVDWEMASLGDPLADLGQHLVYADPAFAPVLGGSAASASDRLPPAADLAERYAAVVGQAVAPLAAAGLRALSAIR